MNTPIPTGKICFYMEFGTGNLVVAAGKFVRVLPIPVDDEDLPILLALRAKGWRFLGAA